MALPIELAALERLLTSNRLELLPASLLHSSSLYSRRKAGFVKSVTKVLAMKKSRHRDQYRSSNSRAIGRVPLRQDSVTDTCALHMVISISSCLALILQSVCNAIASPSFILEIAEAQGPWR